MAVLRKIVIAICSLVLFFALAEGGVRLFGGKPRPVPAPLFSWVERGELYTMEPHRQWVMPGDLKLVRVNSLGLRGPEIQPKTAGPTRVVLLGDSVAFGYDVPEKRAIPAELQRDLRNRGAWVEVIGAAVPGWCARQHRLFLEKHGRDLSPDVVLATVVLNDVIELQKGRAELSASVGVARVLNWLAERSALATTARDALSSSDNPFARAASVEDLAHAPESPASRRGMDLEIEELRALAEAAGATDARFGLLLLPFRFQLEDPTADAPQRRLEAFAHEQGIPVLDLLPALARHPPDSVFLDQVHLTELGNRVVAQNVAHWLLQRGLVATNAR